MGSGAFSTQAPERPQSFVTVTFTCTAGSSPTSGGQPAPTVRVGGVRIATATAADQAGNVTLLALSYTVRKK